jgi:hypothetical protein
VSVCDRVLAPDGMPFPRKFLSHPSGAWCPRRGLWDSPWQLELAGWSDGGAQPAPCAVFISFAGAGEVAVVLALAPPVTFGVLFLTWRAVSGGAARAAGAGFWQRPCQWGDKRCCKKSGYRQGGDEVFAHVGSVRIKAVRCGSGARDILGRKIAYPDLFATAA